MAPIRMCRVCWKRYPQAELSRWVIQQGKLVADPDRRLSGRGVYSCSEACTAKLLQRGLAAIKRKR